jgi:hypothetical protein
MKKATTFILFTVLLISFAFKDKNANYSGHWVSAATENMGNSTWGFRDFNMGKENWEIKFTLYFDSSKTKPVFTFRGVGSYSITGKSTSVAEADEATFRFEKKYVTLHIADTSVIKNFGFAYCNLPVNKEKDITANGCSFLTSQAVCAQEFDLVALKNGKLFLGKRPADGNMCSKDKRPIALGNPLIKK